MGPDATCLICGTPFYTASMIDIGIPDHWTPAHRLLYETYTLLRQIQDYSPSPTIKRHVIELADRTSEFLKTAPEPAPEPEPMPTLRDLIAREVLPSLINSDVPNPEADIRNAYVYADAILSMLKR